MQWRHYNNIKSTMLYIEKLIYEIDLSLNGKRESIFEPLELDLTKQQIKFIYHYIKKIYSLLDDARNTFDIKVEPIKVSKIVEVNTGFIWKTIEDTWSFKIERSTGKIDSIKDKKNIDNTLRKILDSTNKIRMIVNE